MRPSIQAADPDARRRAAAGLPAAALTLHGLEGAVGYPLARPAVMRLPPTLRRQRSPGRPWRSSPWSGWPPRVPGFVVAGFAVGVVVAALMIASGLDHNPQCEFGCDGRWNYPYVGPLALSWFVPVAVLTGLAWVTAEHLWRVLGPK